METSQLCSVNQVYLKSSLRLLDPMRSCLLFWNQLNQMRRQLKFHLRRRLGLIRVLCRLELTDVDWGAMRKALLDSLQKPTGSPYDTIEVMHDQGTHVISETKPHCLHVQKVTQSDDVDMEQRGNSDDDKDSTETFEVTNVIRGADEHGKQMDGYTAKPEDGDELVPSDVVEQTDSRDSIFKVWDLEVPFSDDESELELIKDLKKLLRDNPPEAAYTPPTDAAKALSQINIDELVVGLNDLSLQQTGD